MQKRLLSRRLRIDESLAVAVEQRMNALHRREDLSRFVEWVMDLYCRGYLEETEQYRADARAASRMVRSVGPAKGIIEDDEERKRQAS